MSPRRTVSRFVVAIVATVAACGGEPTIPPEARVVPLRAESTTVAIGRLATFVAPAAELTQDAYSGTIGGAAITLGRVNDSTLAAIVPTVTTGSAAVEVQLGAAVGKATQTVTAGETISNPAQTVTTALNDATTSISVPRPTGYPATRWTADSTFAAQQLAEAKVKLAQLSAADQLELARLLGDAGLGAALRASPSRRASLSSLVQAGGTPEDIACAEQLTGWTNDNKNAEQAAGAAYAVGNSIVKAFILKAVALTTYLKGVMAYAGVKNLCTLEKDFAIESTPDPEGTSLDVTADRYTFIDTDAVQNFFVSRVTTAKQNLKKIYGMLVKLYEWATGSAKAAPPEELPPPTKMQDDVEVESERVNLEVPEATEPDGTKVTLGLVRKSARELVLKGLTTVKARFTTNVSFRVKRTEFADQVVTRPVMVEKVCVEGPAPEVYFGSSCVGKVTLSPATTASLPVNSILKLNVTVTGVDGSTLINRTPRWKSSDETIATVDQSGVVKGVKMGGPVTITASAGPVGLPVSGTALVTVTQPCEMDWIYGTRSAVGSMSNGQLVPMPYGVSNTSEWTVVTSSVFTLDRNGTFVGDMSWYLTTPKGTIHAWGGSVNPGGDRTTFTGTFTASCSNSTGSSVVTIKTVTAKGFVQSNGWETTPTNMSFVQGGTAAAPYLNISANHRLGIYPSGTYTLRHE